MAKYRKKPIVIEAIQFNGSVDSAREIADWANGDRLEAINIDFVTIRDKVDGLQVHTLEGSMQVSVNDWIIKGVKGEFYPCKPDIFEATYELVGEAPKDPTNK